MPEVPSTAYVETGEGGRVAYQVSGEGPVDLLVAGGAPVPLDLLWEEPALVRVRSRLSAFSRTLWVDQRGWGASDRDVDPLSWAAEDATDEQLTAVADAAGSARFAVLAFDIHGPLVIRYAARHPDRVKALILFGSFASCLQDDDCPWVVPIGFLDQLPQLVAEAWGTGFELDVIAPSRKGENRLREWLARGERLGASPAVAGRTIRASYLRDVRDCLGGLRVPTLVLHRRDDPVIPVEAGRYLA